MVNSKSIQTKNIFVKKGLFVENKH